MVEHFCCEVSHDGLGLLVEVTQHGGAIPSPEQLDNIIITAAAEKCHGATSAARSRSDGIGIDARGVLKDTGSVAKLPGYIVGSEVDAFVVAIVRRQADLSVVWDIPRGEPTTVGENQT